MKRPLMVWMLNLDYLCYMQTYVSPSPLTKKRGGVVNYAEIPRPYAHELVEGESQMRHFFSPFAATVLFKHKIMLFC